MIVINHRDCAGESREIECPKGDFQSRRLLLEQDGMGFTLTRTYVRKGGPYRWHYKNHLEACYCVSGSGLLTNEETKEVFNVSEGTMYALDKNESHTLTAYSPMILICVFNPPLKGDEVHREDGSYAS